MNAWLRRKIALQVFNKNGAPRAFPDTFLIGTRLRDVRDWSLVGAVLREADLSDANLSRAKLVDADLSRADLSDAKLLQCRLSPGTIRPCGAKGLIWQEHNLPGQNYHTLTLPIPNSAEPGSPPRRLSPPNGGRPISHSSLTC